MHIYSKLVAGLCRLALGLATVLLLFDFAVIVLNIGARYLFSSPIRGGDEMVAFTMVAIVMLGAPQELRRHGHVAVDIIVEVLPARAKRWAQVWSYLTVLVFSLLLVVGGWHAVGFSLMIGELSEGYLELPVWMMQVFLPMGGILLAMAAIEMIGHAFSEGMPVEDQE